MGSRRDLMVLLLVVAVVVVAYVVTVPTALERSATDPRLSTYRVSPQGGLALRLLLEETGIRTGRRLTPLTHDSLPPVLALLAPVRAPSPGEVAALMSWLREGGTLLYVPGPADPTLDSLDLATVSLVPDDTGVFRPEAGGVAALPTDHRWTEGVDSVVGIARGLAGLPEKAEVLLEAPKGRQPVAALLRVGRGTVLLMADPEPLRNRSLRTSGAAPLVARAAAELAAGGVLVFDEYHHGHRAGAGPVAATLGFLGGTPAGRAVAQLLVLGALAVVVAGRRFGRPLERVPPTRRSPTEHVAALSAALRRAGATETARTLLLGGLARRLGRTPPATEDDRRAFLAWLRRRPASGAAAEELVKEWERGRTADLVALARHADRITELEGAT